MDAGTQRNHFPVKRAPSAKTFSRQSKRRRSAFTLIELLIVVSIIALMGMMLFPAFATARENAKRSSCASNLKQLGMAALQYTQDFDEKLPSAVSNAAGAGKSGGWAYYSSYDTATFTSQFDMSKGSIYPYVNSTKVFICPSDMAGRKSGNSYAINSCTMTADAGTGQDAVAFATGKNIASFDTTANYLYATEEVLRWTLVVGGSPLERRMWDTSTDDGYLQYGAGGDGSQFADVASAVSYNNPIARRHSTGINQGLLKKEGGSCVLFLDGHVKFTRISEIDDKKLRTGGTGICP